MGGIKIKAVIFDLDGTILNTEQGSEQILKEFLGRYGKVVDVEKENGRIGLSMKDSVSATIQDYQLPLTFQQFVEEIQPLYHAMWEKAKSLPGANRLMKHLHKHGVPIGLASNSQRKNIDIKISLQQGWKDLFSVILGSDQVKLGKPAPDMYLEAARQMGVEAADCLVIEDSLVGVKAGIAAGMKVLAVPSLLSERDKFSIADSVLNSLLEFQTDVWGLPAFEDWVSNALPIEPVCFTGVYSKGLVHELLDDEPYLPSQLQGIYFGWARSDDHQIIKVLIGIQWEQKGSSLGKTIQAFVINGSNENVCDWELDIVLVGYIRGLTYMGKENSLKIQDGDKLIANATLDLAEYFNDSCKSLFPERVIDNNGEAFCQRAIY